MAESGLLRERIRIQRHDTATDTWVDLETTPEISAAVEAIGEERYLIRAHYRPDLAGLKDAAPASRIQYRGRDLEILDIREVGWREDLEMTAQLLPRVDVPDLGSSAHRTTKWP